ncbi:MAG: outer membrane beta-barrel protein [Gemmatimonadota bacterium]|nr:outer membrane beta-barrel protein [Gemmatimonadota bacterium]MDH3421906.1 outer membrane beta-barrel protein [Gemmatimonadota bacterium]
MRRILAVSFTLSLLAAISMQSISAQESTTRGFNLGIHLSAASIEIDNERSNAGGGGLWIGYGFNRRVQLFLQLDGAEFDVSDTDVTGTWTMGHGDLGVRFHFANSLRSWVPYLQAAISGRAVSVDNATVEGTPETDVALTGGALTLGGGILFYFSQSLAADLQLLWSGGEFTQVKVNNVTVDLTNPLEAQSSRFNIGLSWWP